MRATQRELDGELIRWVALDPATISPAVQPCKREKEKLTSVCSLSVFPFLGFCLCTAPDTPEPKPDHTSLPLPLNQESHLALLRARHPTFCSNMKQPSRGLWKLSCEPRLSLQSVMTTTTPPSSHLS